MGKCTKCSLTRATQPLWWEAASVPALRGWWDEGAEAVTASHKPTHSALVGREKRKENARRDKTKAKVWG